MARRTLTLENEVAAELAGSGDSVLRALREKTTSRVHLRGNRLTLEGDEAEMEEIRKFTTPRKVRMANGSAINVRYTGEAKLKVANASSATLKLERVRYSPKFSMNLLSIPALMRQYGKDARMEMFNDRAIFTASGKIIFTCKKLNDLFVVDTMTEIETIAAAGGATPVS